MAGIEIGTPNTSPITEFKQNAYYRAVPTVSFTLRAISGTTGSAIPGAFVRWGGYAQYTNSTGYCSFLGVPCQTSGLFITTPAYIQYHESFTPHCGATQQYERGCAPDQPCFGGQSVLQASTYRFDIGDTVYVAATGGVGLKAWTLTCSGAYANKGDGSVGTILDDPECCGGHTRWKIRWFGDPIDRWSAEGDPNTGEFWLWKLSQTHTISGVVTHNGSPLSGVVMQGLPGNPSTNGSGAYSAGVPSGFSGTATPVKSGYSFSPASRSYSGVNGSMSNQNYTAAVVNSSYEIEGDITLGGQPMTQEVLMYVSPSVPGSPFSAEDDYEVTVPAGWSGTITPVAAGYQFNPSSRSYTNVDDDESNDDFSASIPPPEDATLTVAITPQGAVDDGAAWRPWIYRDGNLYSYGYSWRSGGETMSLNTNNEYEYSYRIEFKSLESKDWNTPPDQWVEPLPAQAYQITGTYTPMSGTVSVTINPQAARDAEAQWRVAGGPWRNSGFAESNVVIGTQTVEFKPVPGWIHPANRIISVGNNQATNIADQYVNQGMGPLVVSISPNSGPLAGGTQITIHGANFADPASVLFDGDPSAQVTLISDTELRAVTPARPTLGSVDVQVNVPSGLATVTNGFTYLAGVGQNVRLVGQYGGLTEAVAVQGNYAYISAGPRFVIVDVSVPSSPVRKGTLLLEGIIKRIVVSGAVAYVAASDKGLYTIDVSNHNAPALLGIYDTPGTALGLSVLGGIAYVADGSEGLQVIDVFNPAAPTLLGTVNTAGNAKCVVVKAAPEGVFAYLADGWLPLEQGTSRLHIVDVSTPDTPQPRGSYETLSDIWTLDVASGKVYTPIVEDAAGRVRVIDVSNPDAPFECGSVLGAFIKDVRVTGGYVYTLRDDLLRVHNTINPCVPFELSQNTEIGDGRQIAIQSGKAYIANGRFGLSIYNVSNPSATPSLLGSYSGATMPASSITVGNDRAFVGPTGNSGVRVIDISNPADPLPLGAHDLSGRGVYSSGGLAIVGNHLYAAAQHVGLQILSVSDPSVPTICGIYSSNVWAFSVTVVNNLAYLGETDLNGSNPVLRILDVSNPCSATPLGYCAFSGASVFPVDIALQNDLAYVVDIGGSKLRIVDVSDSSSPTLQGTLPIPSGSLGAVAVSGSSAYLTSLGSGIQIADVSNPTNLSLVASYDTPGAAFDVVVSQSLAFVADGSGGGLQVLDVTSPTSPQLVGSYDTAGSARGVAVDGYLAYIADESGGLVALELLDFRPPTVTITYPVFAPTYSTGSPTVNLGGAASDDRGVVQVTWVNNRGGGGIAGGTPESWTVAGVALQPGANMITVTAYDQEGNAGADVITVTYNAPADTQAPSVEINSPTNQSSYSTDVAALNIGGIASDDRELSQVTWTNSRGGSGNASGLTTWTANGIALQPGENVITVSGIDAASNIGADTLTVTYIPLDADGDGVPDITDTCPDTVPGAVVDENGCPLVIYGDSDRDGDVDSEDFAAFVECRSRSGVLTLPACAAYDRDGDDDVDLDEFGAFQRCYSGEHLPAEPACDD